MILDLWNWRPEVATPTPAPPPPVLPVVATPPAPSPAPLPRFAAPPGKHSIAVMSSGPTTTVLYLTAGHLDGPLIVVVDDGVRWSAAWHPRAQTEMEGRGWVRGTRLAAGIALAKWQSASMHIKGMVDWARRAGLSAINDHAQTGAMDLRNVGVTRAPCPLIGEVRYDGWADTVRHSAHRFEALHGAVVAAVEACAAAWNWQPTGLTLSFFPGGRAVGLAYQPGRGDRRIALSRELLAKYDITSVKRAILHELCHHAREELFPRPLTGYSRELAALMSHDEKFCEMLAKVDPVVAADPRSCRYFNDDMDAEAVKSDASRKGIVYNAAAGVIHLAPWKRTSVRFRWEPTGTARWRPEWQPYNEGAWRSFLAMFPEADRRIVPTFMDSSRRALTAPAPLPLHAFVARLHEQGFKVFAKSLEGSL
jgi:predicted SprT family Zn-dependent metalloprotease